jgi:hypothetical protein
MAKIKMNDFAKRQVPGSGFSYYDGTFEQLEALVEASFDDAYQRAATSRLQVSDGIFAVDIANPRSFYSGIVPLVGGAVEVFAAFVPRREGESPELTITAASVASHGLVREMRRAVAVDVIVYSHDKLGAEASTDADYEIVSINARLTVGPEPMQPITMARNMLGLAGGTKATYTAEQFAEAIMFWSHHAMSRAS